MKYEEWLAQVSRRVLKATRSPLSAVEKTHGFFSAYHAYHEAHLSVDEAVAYFTGRD